MDERVHVRYSSVPSRDEFTDREYASRDGRDLRFSYELPVVVPWKSILLALCLLFFGTLFLIISHLIFTSHLVADSAQAYSFMVLGIIIFLPGFYETRMAYYSWRGAKGYSFSKIPDF